MAEREFEATSAASTGSGASAGDGVLAPAILEPPVVPGAGRPRDENPVLAYLVAHCASWVLGKPNSSSATIGSSTVPAGRAGRRVVCCLGCW